MNIRTLAASAGLLLNLLATSSWAQAPSDIPQNGTSLIDIAGHPVPVPKGGLYDRFRSNPPLAVIQAEAPDIDLTWFKELKKTKVDMGFESHSPNFYYKNSRVTAIFTADLQRLKTLMPESVLKEVQPLQVWPGRGLVAITAYAYQLCDNDSYNEVALSIVTSRPGGANWGPLTLLGQSVSKDYWGYVLKLPVNTELARVRGVVGYNLPKWLTGIHLKDHGPSLTFEITDDATGKTDVVFEATKLDGLSDKVEMVKNSFTNLDAAGRLASGHAVSRQLRHASSSRSDAFSLQLSDGSLSTYIKALQLGRMVKYEYVPAFQSALYAPEPLSAIAARR